MSKIALPALYQTETFGSTFRHNPHRNRQMASSDTSPAEAAPASQSAPGVAPRRAPDFLVQLMVGGDQDMRKVIGRRDVAESREAAYGATSANRPSQKREPARFVTITA